MSSLAGQTAVVTGGGRGLGRTFAEALAAAGASVVVVSRSAEELAETVASIEQAGGQARAVIADVTDGVSLTRAFDAIGAVDLLVNNAGVLGPIGPFHETPFDDWWRAVEVNLRGAMQSIGAGLPGMVERKRGRIINIVTGAVPIPYLSAYTTSKTALVRATESIATEVRAHGIAIFSVAPGTIRTAMTERSLTSPEGRRWIPWFRRIFDEGLNLPAERPAQLILALASGKLDKLSGLYLSPFDDLDAMVASIDKIEAEKLHSLRIRTLATSSSAASVASIRDEAERAR